MKKMLFRILILALGLVSFSPTRAQVAINPDGSSPDPSAMLDIQSLSKGLLVPRMSTAQRYSISGPATGLLIFDTDSTQFFFYAGLSWEKVNTQEIAALIADADADTKIQVEESSDEDIIHFDLGGTEFFRMDSGRLEVLNTGGSLYIGGNAGMTDVFTNQNIFIGNNAGSANTEGFLNTALGLEAMASNTTGFNNLAIGAGALTSNTEGTTNLAFGVDALYSNTTGGENIGIGTGSLFNNTEGNNNVALGTSALKNNTTGSDNVAFGSYTLRDLQTGISNVAIGANAGFKNVSGEGNLFLGYRSGYNETGSDKLYIENSSAGKNDALIYGEFDNNWVRIGGYLTPEGGIADTDNDTKIQIEESNDEDFIRFDVSGVEAMIIDTAGNIGIGITQPEHKLHVGGDMLIESLAGAELNLLNGTSGQEWQVVSGVFNGFEIGHVNSGNTDANAYFFIDDDGNVGIGTINPGYALQVGEMGDGTVGRANAWTTFSDRRWKKDFEVIPDALDKLGKVNGYYYYWKTGVDTTQQVGVVAQEIEEILPQCVSTDAEGYMSVDYGKLTAWLIQVNKEQQEQIETLINENAVLQQHAARIDRLEAMLLDLQAASPGSDLSISRKH